MPDIHSPAGFVPLHALAFGANDAAATAVDAAHPLPTAPTIAAASSVPLVGTASASGALGPYVPQLGRTIWVTLSGTWSGSVQLLRSTDGGATRLPLTYGDGTAKPNWSGNLNAPVAEETVAAATYYLGVTLSSGTLSYRMEQ